ncbi:MAG: hypothetical protein ACJKTH_01545 [Patescibacteria group bacterium UBA2163]
METIDYSQFLGLIPPAIAISISVYLVHFFGKIIADQVPFADDRKWQIQLSGTMFMLNMMFGVIGIYLATLYPWGIGHWWLHLITFAVLSFVGGTLFVYNLKESSRVFNHSAKIITLIDEKFDGIASFYANIGKYMGVGIIPIIVFYFGTLEFLSGNIYWIIIFFVFIFLIFIWSAFGYSLTKLKDITPVDIHFKDRDREPLYGARILKFNDDNIRARVGDTIYFLNKNEVLMTEMKIPEKFL